jgi:hypothetical protein
MDTDEKLQIMSDVFDITWDEYEHDVNEDLVRFTRAVVTDACFSWYDDDPFIDILMDNFDDEHGLWQYISID